MHIEQIITEPMYICDICGKKKPSSQMLGKCSKCGVYVCNTCGRIKGDRVYCKAAWRLFCCYGSFFRGAESYGGD